MTWYDRVTADPNDLSPLSDCLAHFEAELAAARRELGDIEGKRIDWFSRDIGGMTMERFNQLQELEAILEFLNIQFTRIKGRRYRAYLENYDRALSSRDADKYAESDDEVIDCALLVNRVALVRNQFLGIIKGLDALNYRLGDITKLRVAGLDDATL